MNTKPTQEIVYKEYININGKLELSQNKKLFSPDLVIFRSEQALDRVINTLETKKDYHQYKLEFSVDKLNELRKEEMNSDIKDSRVLNISIKHTQEDIEYNTSERNRIINDIKFLRSDTNTIIDD
jgi:hypothetical protein